MGTNYYLHENVCRCCHRSDVVHVCKSFRLWHAPLVEDDVGRQSVGPVRSVKDWKRRIDKAIAEGGRIVSEYGDEVDPADFMARAYRSSDEQRRRQFKYVERHPLPYDPEAGQVVPRGSWVDDEGFSFYAGEFS